MLKRRVRSAGGTPFRSTHRPIQRGIAALSDLTAYRRLVARGRIPPVFVPRGGWVFVRVGLAEIPGVALAARLAREWPDGAFAAAVRNGTCPGTWVTERLREAGARNVPPPPAAGAFLELVAAGVGRAALAVLYPAAAGEDRTRADVGELARAVTGIDPALSAHLDDRSLSLLARRLSVEEDRLRRWAGYTPEVELEYRTNGGFFRRFVETGLAERLMHSSPEEVSHAVAALQAAPPTYTPEWRPPPGLDFDRLRDWYRTLLSEDGVSAAGRVFSRLSWPAARALFQTDAAEAVGVAACALVAAGERVVGITPSEILVEVRRDFTDDFLGRVREDVEHAMVPLLGPYIRGVSVEEVERW